MARRALMLREGRAPIRDRLLTMLFFAALLHGLVILGITFKSPAVVTSGGSALDVLLVSNQLPEADRNDTATYLAQRTQLGSGTTLRSVVPRNQAEGAPAAAQQGTSAGRALRPSSPTLGSRREPVLGTSGWSTRVAYFTEVGGRAASEEQPMLLERQPSDGAGPGQSSGPVRLRGPHRSALWVSPDTRAAALAPYLVAWRRKVERIGTLDFPAAARSPGPHSSPVIQVVIGADGRLLQARIRRSSGDPRLDAAALAILRVASPFDPFPPDLARRYRALRFAYEWQFLGGRVGPGAISAVP